MVAGPIAIGVKAGKSSRTRAPRQSAEKNTLKCLAAPDAPMKVEPISEGGIVPNSEYATACDHCSYTIRGREAPGDGAARDA
jgi:hypothetical protein